MAWLLIAIGLFSFSGGAFGWGFFMNNRKAQRMVWMLGEGGARVFYCLLGAAIAGVGLAGLLDIVSLK